MADNNGTDDGGSLIWLLFKAVTMIIGIVVLVGFLLSIFHYLIGAAVLGALVYLTYRLLTGSKPALSTDSPRYLLEATDEDPMQRKLRLLEEEDRRLNEEIDRLSRE
jgi:hypothetical protein